MRVCAGQLQCIGCPGGQFATTLSKGSTDVAQCMCDPRTSYSDANGACIPCRECPLGTYINPSLASQCNAATGSSGDMRCLRCGHCGPWQFLHPDFLCTGGDSKDTQSNKDACKACQPSCPSLDQVLVQGCNAGTGSVDTSRCISGFRSIHAMACENNWYLGYSTLYYTTTLPAAYQIVPSPDSTAFAEVMPFTGVKIYLSESTDQPIIAAGNQQPIMEYLPLETGYRQVASCVWSLDGTTLFVVRMDAVIVRMQARQHCFSFPSQAHFFHV